MGALAMPSAIHVLPERIDLTTVQEVLAAASNALENGSRVFDFSAVNQLDSTALALVLACARMARERHVEIRCINVSDNLLSLARLYGVDTFLPVEAS